LLLQKPANVISTIFSQIQSINIFWISQILMYAKYCILMYHFHNTVLLNEQIHSTFAKQWMVLPDYLKLLKWLQYNHTILNVICMTYFMTMTMYWYIVFYYIIYALLQILFRACAIIILCWQFHRIKAET